MTWINSYVSSSLRKLIWKINKLISSGGPHGWRVRAFVYRQALCCTFGWTRKSPWQHTGEGHDGADGYPSYSLHSRLPGRRCYRCDKMSKLDQGPVPGVSPLSLSLPLPLSLSLSTALSQFNLSLFHILPNFVFISILSIPAPCAYLKPKISWLHSQARWGDVNCSQGESWHIC